MKLLRDLQTIEGDFSQNYSKDKNNQKFSGSPRGGGELPPPPETEKIVVEKWCYFPELYKMTKVVEDGIGNG